MRAVLVLILAGTVGDATFSTFKRGEGGAGKKYLIPAVRNRARGLAVFRKFLSFLVVSLFVNCKN